ncbi:unnamed protein product [Brassicogethes aeneus]|uniref:Cytosolic fatty-acid binding proteins domain-containing protein n=1 Tax=Brassicogethes aeneus TaxID=1431903 RepID=A0A9P0AVV4_BRAAE|nr:unnamed protein product [Brassicogethes aeneus]
MAYLKVSIVLFLFGVIVAVNCGSTKSLDDFLGKKYELHESKNFDEYMKALGVGFFTRKFGAAASPVIDLSKQGDEYTLTSISTFKNVYLKFKPGVEFDQETPDGRDVKATITVDGTTIHEVQKDADGKTNTLDRTWSPTEVKMVMTIDNITATRIYKVIP